MHKLIVMHCIILVHFAFGVQPIDIIDAWVREVPPVSSVTAVYMIIKNNGDKDDRLIEVKTKASKFAEIHKTSVDQNGIAKMKKVRVLDIPSGKSVELKPGGIHIMLMELKEPLKEGDKVELDLIFENIGNKKIHVEVRGMGKHIMEH